MIKRKNKLDIHFVSDIHEILKNLQLGTTIPIWPEFSKYILFDLNHFHAKSILLTEIIGIGNITGHVLIFYHDIETLYFGFFGVIDDNEEKIDFLIRALINYAKENNFKSIRGPINIPTIIYGWGFMEEGSKTDLFIGKPVNPPIYQDLFIKNGFFVKIKEVSWEGYFKRIPEKEMDKFDFSEYELFHPKDWDELMSLKKIFLEINARNLAPESILTPDSGSLFHNYVLFVKEYGDLFMFLFVRYKKTGEIVGCMASTPNPFRRNEQGNYDSFAPFTIAVDKEHRKKGVGLLLSKNMFDLAYERHIRYSSTPIESSRKVTVQIAKFKLDLSNPRTHLILEFTL